MTETKSILRAAICEFKKKVDKITKDKDNPFFKSKYADLSVILEVIDKDLAESGLTLTSYTLYEGEDLILRTDLKHKDSDEIITSVFPVFGSKPQEIGSSITYARRYNVQSLLNLAASDDDDGNGANNTAPIKKPAVKATAKSNKEQYQEYMDCLNKVTSKELWDKVKGKKDSWVLWANKQYSEEYGEQLNDKFIALAKQFEPSASEILDDDLPPFLQ